MVERCPDKTEVDGPIPSTLTQGGIALFIFEFAPVYKTSVNVQFHPQTHFMKNDIKKPYWQEPMMVFGKMSGWVAGPVLVSLFLGRWLDSKFHTAPFIFIGMTGIAFGISIYGIIREAKKSLNNIKSNEQSSDTK